jgi:hypothetical protein
MSCRRSKGLGLCALGLLAIDIFLDNGKKSGFCFKKLQPNYYKVLQYKTARKDYATIINDEI